MAPDMEIWAQIVSTLGPAAYHRPDEGSSVLLDFWPVLIAGLALIWGVREWVYGGSVLVVKLELGYSDGIQLVHGSPSDFADPGALQRLFDTRVTNPAIDLAVVTVTNRGRTPATVLRPGLIFDMSGVAPVFVGGILLGDLGEAEDRVRIEAHDSRTFVMPLGGMVSRAVADTNFQKAESMTGKLRARAQVTSGTGRVKRSPERSWQNWSRRAADWAVKVPLRGKPLRIEEELLDSFVDSRSRLYDQFLFVGGILLEVRSGKSDEDILAGLGTVTDAFKAALILARARVLVNAETKP